MPPSSATVRPPVPRWRVTQRRKGSWTASSRHDSRIRYGTIERNTASLVDSSSDPRRPQAGGDDELGAQRPAVGLELAPLGLGPADVPRAQRHRVGGVGVHAGTPKAVITGKEISVPPPAIALTAPAPAAAKPHAT